MWYNVCSSHSCCVVTSTRTSKPSGATSQRRRSCSPRSCHPIGRRPACTSQSRDNWCTTDSWSLHPYWPQKVWHAFVIKSINTTSPFCALLFECNDCLAYWFVVAIQYGHQEYISYFFYVLFMLRVMSSLVRAFATYSNSNNIFLVSIEFLSVRIFTGWLQCKMEINDLFFNLLVNWKLGR